MSGFDADITLHLHEGRWEDAQAQTSAACRLLERYGFSVTQKATVPYVPLASAEEVRRFMCDADMPEENDDG